MGSVAVRRANARRAVDRAMAERVLVIPTVDGGAVLGGPDPDNPPYETVGIYRQASALQEVKGRGSNRGERSQARGARRGLSFSREAVGGPGMPLPQPGWHVQLLDQDGQPSFRFIPAEFGAAGRISFDLVPLGAIE